jgi:dihydroxyacetone kinase
MMGLFLKDEHHLDATLENTVKTALDAWSVGHLALAEEETKQLPERAAIAKHRQEQLANIGIEAAILERGGKTTIRYRALTDKELRPAIAS